jgi:hypothetical protein
MSPITTQSPPKAGLNLVLFTIPQSLLLEIGIASILLLLASQKATVEALESIGQASEELFRGDRLPILPFPQDDDLVNKS